MQQQQQQQEPSTPRRIPLPLLLLLVLGVTILTTAVLTWMQLGGSGGGSGSTIMHCSLHAHFTPHDADVTLAHIDALLPCAHACHSQSTRKSTAKRRKRSNVTVMLSFAAGRNPVHRRRQQRLRADIERVLPSAHGIYESGETIGAAYYALLRDARMQPNTTRGFHFWSWKPYIILRAMRAAPRDAIVAYADVDAFFLRDPGVLLDMAHHCGRLLLGNYHTNLRYTKCAVLEHEFGHSSSNRSSSSSSSKERERFLASRQLVASFAAFRNTPEQRRFVAQWLQRCLDYVLVSDEPSSTLPSSNCTEHSEFRENRHDQLMLSLGAFKARDTPQAVVLNAQWKRYLRFKSENTD
jgi:hypothetical protein